MHYECKEIFISRLISNTTISSLDIQCDDVAQATFCTSSWSSAWVKYAQPNPVLWEKTRLFLLFQQHISLSRDFARSSNPSSYHNRLDFMASGALRLKLTSVLPAVKEHILNNELVRIKVVRIK